MNVNSIGPWQQFIRQSVNDSIVNAGNGIAGKYFSETAMNFFLNRGKEHPSLAKIIAVDEIRKFGLSGEIKFFNNYKSRTFYDDRNKFEEAFNNLYPVTGRLRTRLISDGRVKMDTVTPKASGLKKFFIYSNF